MRLLVPGSTGNLFLEKIASSINLKVSRLQSWQSIFGSIISNVCFVVVAQMSNKETHVVCLCAIFRLINLTF